MTTVLSIVGGIFSVYIISLLINGFITQIVTSPDGGPYGVEKRVFYLVLNRDYLKYGWQDNIVRLCRWGGFLLWMFFVYMFIQDIRIKIKKCILEV